jgi:hypothetical protein
MLNHNQTAIVLAIGLVVVLMTLASTRVFAQPTLPPSQIDPEAQIQADIHAQEQAIVSANTHTGRGGGGPDIMDHVHIPEKGPCFNLVGTSVSCLP